MTLANNTLLAIEEVIYKERFYGGGLANIFDQHNNKIKRIGNIKYTVHKVSSCLFFSFQEGNR